MYSFQGRCKHISYGVTSLESHATEKKQILCKRKKALQFYIFAPKKEFSEKEIVLKRKDSQQALYRKEKRKTKTIS